MSEKAPQQQPPPQQAPPQEHHHHHGVGKAAKGLAKKFGDSVMFGAGATLGSDIMRKLGG